MAVPSLDALNGSDHEVVGVLTRPDAPVGRKRVLTPSPVKVRALELGLPVYEASRLRGEILDTLEGLGIDAVAVVAYGAIAGPRALAAARHGWFNLHFSLLPQWRGAAPVQRALMAGQETSGVTVFRIDTGMDTGPILASRELPLDAGDTAAVFAEYSREGASLLVEAMDSLAAGTAELHAQVGEASHADKLEAADAFLDFRRPASELVAHSRGVSPAPGPWAPIAGKKTKLFGLRTAPDSLFEAAGPRTSGSGAPGSSASIDPALPAPGTVFTLADEVAVACGDGAVLVETIQPFGKQRMSAGDFLRGHAHVRFDVDEGTAPDSTRESSSPESSTARSSTPTSPNPPEPHDHTFPAAANQNRGPRHD